MFTINKASKQKNKTIPFDNFVIMKVKNQFRIKISKNLSNISLSQSTSFSEYTKFQSLWIRELIQNYNHNTKEEIVLYHINKQTLLIISTYGAK